MDLTLGKTEHFQTGNLANAFVNVDICEVIQHDEGKGCG